MCCGTSENTLCGVLPLLDLDLLRVYLFCGIVVVVVVVVVVAAVVVVVESEILLSLVTAPRKT
jgi:hypothetical protein